MIGASEDIENRPVHLVQIRFMLSRFANGGPLHGRRGTDQRHVAQETHRNVPFRIFDLGVRQAGCGGQFRNLQGAAPHRSMMPRRTKVKVTSMIGGNIHGVLTCASAGYDLSWQGTSWPGAPSTEELPMQQHAKPGFWMVLVPGAVAYLQYKDDPEPKSPARIYDLLVELGFLDDIPRERKSILATIAIRLGNRYDGLIPD